MDMAVEVEIPIHLRSTVLMVSNSFPSGLTNDEYEAVICLLYDYMSDRNLADVLRIVTGKDAGVIMNDIYRVQNICINFECEKVRARFVSFGFERWVKEE